MTNKVKKCESANDEIERLFKEELAKLPAGSLDYIGISDIIERMKKEGLTARTIKKEIEKLKQEIDGMIPPQILLCPSCLRRDNVLASVLKCQFCGTAYRS